jgi:hypothetical protein
METLEQELKAIREMFLNVLKWNRREKFLNNNLY